MKVYVCEIIAASGKVLHHALFTVLRLREVKGHSFLDAPFHTGTLPTDF